MALEMKFPIYPEESQEQVFYLKVLGGGAGWIDKIVQW